MRSLVGGLFPILLSVASLAWAAVFQVPDGWRLPSEEDMTGAWAEFKGHQQSPYHVRADFNGDGWVDDAYIVLSKTGSKWALFVNLGSGHGKSETITLAEDSGKNPVQNMALWVVKPGKYKTACGKGYSPCDREEPPELELRLPAINFHLFEGASSFFWWDKKSQKFLRVWMSD